MEKHYVETVRLLLESAPIVFEFSGFAMKGGTTLNLFIHDIPRLSVDIDVVYTDRQKSRAEALAHISEGLNDAKKRLSARGLSADLVTGGEAGETKLLVRRSDVMLKVEVNHVFRGTLLPIEMRRLSEHARSMFTTEISVPVLALPELYAGKIVAALDRQHPRDFFDIQHMFSSSGLQSLGVECFVCYLAGHNRPIHEVLSSPRMVWRPRKL